MKAKVKAAATKRKQRRAMLDPAMEACERCGYTRRGHALVNYADGPMIGSTHLICPFATAKFKSEDRA